AVLPDVSVWIDCSGCVCLLRLTTERVHEVVQAELDSGRWALEELARAMHLSLQSPEGTDTEDEILEILDAAKTILGKDYLAQVLAIPLQGSWACTVAGLAAHSGLTSVLKILIDAGAPISQPRLPASCAPRGDYSPLSLAIAGQHWECVSLLIASGSTTAVALLKHIIFKAESCKSHRRDPARMLQQPRELRVIPQVTLQFLLVLIEAKGFLRCV
ncbi:Kinase D-interacting substrate of 220 kDa, partial [Durusdinium trenchii]